MAKSKIQEIVEEFRTVFGGNNRIIDVILPTVVFLVANRALGLSWASGLSLLTAFLFLAYRLQRGQIFGYAITGLISVALAAGISSLTNSAASFFLPDIIGGGISFVAAIVSVFIKRPLAALSSHLTRGWALSWYQHQNILPAYAEVTWGWAIFLGLRLALQIQTYLTGSTETVGIVQIASGWPALILVLIASYLYGIWRLGNLAGPSVAEFEAEIPPPWKGQQRGF
jgi:hypothetical protein